MSRPLWDNSIPFYWVVICKNAKFHHHTSRLYSHVIRLGETDEVEDVPVLHGSFAVRCDECEKESPYEAADLRRIQLEPLEGFKPHALFR